MFDQHWTLPAESLTAIQMATLQKEFKIEYQAERKQVILSKREAGHIVLTNYDPATLSNEERIRMNEEADQGTDNDVRVDIRPGYPGGEWPIHGVFRLRSFHNVLILLVSPSAMTPNMLLSKIRKLPALARIRCTPWLC